MKNKSDVLMGKGESGSALNDAITQCSIQEHLFYLQAMQSVLLSHNGLWMYYIHLFRYKSINKPYIITPHGMLLYQTLKRSY